MSRSESGRSDVPVTFCSIVLNEAEYLAANIRQHVAHCDRWIIVEGEDRRYPRDRVTPAGLSTDATAEIARQAASDFPGKVQFVQHGWAADKCELRNVYANRVQPGVVIVFDADEFLQPEQLDWLIDCCAGLPTAGTVRIPHIHYWRSTDRIVTGGYYDVPHDRAYRWTAGAHYIDNHNNPCLPSGEALRDVRSLSFRRDLRLSDGRWSHPCPAWYHFGFCKAAENIADKNAYYVARGERETRPGTTRDRAAWFEPRLPGHCQQWSWGGYVPEIFSAAQHGDVQ